MLDRQTMKTNCKMLNGDISKNLPICGMNMDATITRNELKTAKIKNLFLKMPTLMAG